MVNLLAVVARALEGALDHLVLELPQPLGLVRRRLSVEASEEELDAGVADCLEASGGLVESRAEVVELGADGQVSILISGSLREVLLRQKLREPIPDVSPADLRSAEKIPAHGQQGRPSAVRGPVCLEESQCPRLGVGVGLGHWDIGTSTCGGAPPWQVGPPLKNSGPARGPEVRG